MMFECPNLKGGGQQDERRRKNLDVRWEDEKERKVRRGREEVGAFQRLSGSAV